REYEGERILVVANTSRFVQYAELDLAAYDGLVPVEMFGRVEFPRLGDRPFFLTLAPHGFVWFSLEPDPSGYGREVRSSSEQPPTLVEPAELRRILAPEGQLTRLLAAYIRGRRWFRSKARRIKRVTLQESIPLAISVGEAAVAIFAVEYTEGEAETYVLPLALAHSEDAERIVRDAPHALVAYVTPAGEEGPRWLLYDALHDSSVAAGLLDAVGLRKRLNGRQGQLAASPTRAFRQLRGERADELTATASRAEQSNSSVVFGDRLNLKVFRRLEPGINPDLEIGQALTEIGFEHVPQVAGWLAYRPRQGEPSAIAIVQQYVPNQGDAWEFTLDAVSAFYERAATVERPAEESAVSISEILGTASDEPPQAASEIVGSYLDAAWLLGVRTADLHGALASITNQPAFAPEPFTALYQRSLLQNLRNQAQDVLGLLGQRLPQLAPEIRASARLGVDSGPQIRERLRAVVDRRMNSLRIRCHGDFHAGQVLWTGKDFVIIDFEGEPGRPLSERRHKRSAMTDVAGMLRSFHYAAFGTLLNPRVGGAVRPEDVPRLQAWGKYWYRWVASSYLRGYREIAAGAAFLPPDNEEMRTLLEAAALQKVLYELAYELNNRPEWVLIPLRGLLELLRIEDADDRAD
ncbi:MAG TPA: putative maltokinase, partial [Candidatus Caenarcaniphilales bacterium]|nr:putative maltokinase [Candidatus Caenarcaniphilales bacterium]